MSLRNNQIATQAETADLVSALSEASGSSTSSSAPYPCDAWRFSQRKLIKTLNRLRPVALLGWDSVPFLQSRHSRFLLQAAIYFFPRMTCLRVGSANRDPWYDVARFLEHYAIVGSDVTTVHDASEHRIFLASHVANVLLWEPRRSRYHGGVDRVTTRWWCTVAVPSSTACSCLARSTITIERTESWQWSEGWASRVCTECVCLPPGQSSLCVGECIAQGRWGPRNSVQDISVGFGLDCSRLNVYCKEAPGVVVYSRGWGRPQFAAGRELRLSHVWEKRADSLPRPQRSIPAAQRSHSPYGCTDFHAEFSQEAYRDRSPSSR